VVDRRGEDDEMKARATCPWCSKVLGVATPRGGDGSADVFPRHYPGERPTRLSVDLVKRCLGSRAFVEHEDYVK
jgi:hypothetical protein